METFSQHLFLNGSETQENTALSCRHHHEELADQHQAQEQREQPKGRKGIAGPLSGFARWGVRGRCGGPVPFRRNPCRCERELFIGEDIHAGGKPLKPTLGTDDPEGSFAPERT